jgi:dihydrofolate synthase/folylpolyglutamate synthase
MRFNTLDAWLTWLEKPQTNLIDLGLERVSAISSSLKINKFSSKVITVAGTNGKGSTIAALSAILGLSHGDLIKPKVGIYTSPHLINFNERIKIDGCPVSDLELLKAFDEVDECRLKQNISLTYFEFTTLVALLIFSRSNLDYILLEVGLGGRLDAVNVIDSDIAIITSIGIDHQEWLGNTREEIAFEKAGILRKNKPCIISDLDPPESLKNEIKKLNCHAFFASSEISSNYFKYENKHNLDTTSIVGHDKNGKSYSFKDLPTPKLAIQSWSAAFQASILLKAIPSYSNFVTTMKNLTLVGRQQHFNLNNRELIIDVAHNPQSVEFLVQHLKSYYSQSDSSKFIAIFACMKDKDFKKIFDLMSPLIKKWYFPVLHNNSRAANPSLLVRSLNECDLKSTKNHKLDTVSDFEISKSVKDSLINTINNGLQDDKIVIFGSFYIVSEAIPFLEELC